MAFMASTKNHTISPTGILSADCALKDKPWRPSTLNLNLCIGNNNGNLTARFNNGPSGQDFVSSSSNIRREGSLLIADCKDDHSSPTYAAFEFNPYVANRDGILEFVHPRYGPKGLGVDPPVIGERKTGKQFGGDLFEESFRRAGPGEQYQISEGYFVTKGI